MLFYKSILVESFKFHVLNFTVIPLLTCPLSFVMIGRMERKKERKKREKERRERKKGEREREREFVRLNFQVKNNNKYICFQSKTFYYSGYWHQVLVTRPSSGIT
jgi:hypothetical protein